MKLTNSILSDLLSIPVSKMRRWTKEFMPPDPRATRRSGYTRELTPNEGFYIFLGGHLVTNLGWTYYQARTALEKIWPWLEKNGMVPEIPKWAKREGIDGKISRYELMYFWADDPSSNALSDVQVQGVCSDEGMEDKTDSLGRPYISIKSETILYHPIAQIKTDPEKKSKWGYYRGRNVGVLDLDDLFHRFLRSIFDESQNINWQKRFREIAKPD